MSIRLAQQEDAAAISLLIGSLAHFCCEKDCDDLPAWFMETISEQAIRKRIRSADYLNYVYIDNKIIVGYISIKDKNHLYHLFVQADHQGRGIARQLWQTASEASPAKQVTVRSSLNAVPVYEKFGFRKTSPPEHKKGIQYQPMKYIRGR